MYSFDIRNLHPKEIHPPTAKSIFHSKHKQGNNIDPDLGNSRLCSACNLPIFSTPFQATELGSDRPPTCNACVQFISPPFYTCSQCPKLFLHDSCARLPSVLCQNPIGNPLKLIKPRMVFKRIEETTCCHRSTNGFTFEAGGTKTDVMCALMPTSITHAAHATTHVLLRSSYAPASDELEACRCCGGILSGVSYKCGTCRNFSIHATCARLPATVRHVCDPHPLMLVTAPPPPRRRPPIYCDACERGLDDTRWYYGCAECEQAFHVECVPCLDKLSLLKYEITEMRQKYHECPLTLVRVHMVCGRRCGKCGKGYLGHRDSLALACFKCNFSIHASCADNILSSYGKLLMCK